MSHIVTITTEIRDPLAAACRCLSLPEPVHGTATLFEGQATGLIVRLPGWMYPAVAYTATGQLRYDFLWGRLGCARTLEQIHADVRGGEGTDRGAQARPLGPRAAPGRRLDPADHHRGRCLVKTIEITVGPAGETKVETKGYTGAECRAASAFVEQALGRKAAEVLTAEYYQGQETRLSQGP